ncbi:hypothetical protein BJY52DRAFT_1228858 [Lactarius psammicola]|nr:hypothetical protein BJY52DRAFT_1228858 [Lactarius psammicola]
MRASTGKVEIMHGKAHNGQQKKSSKGVAGKHRQVYNKLREHVDIRFKIKQVENAADKSKHSTLLITTAARLYLDESLSTRQDINLNKAMRYSTRSSSFGTPTALLECASSTPPAPSLGHATSFTDPTTFTLDSCTYLAFAACSRSSDLLDIGGSRLLALKSKVNGLKLHIDTANEETTEAEVAVARADKDSVKFEGSIASNRQSLEGVEIELGKPSESLQENPKDVPENMKADLDEKAESVGGEERDRLQPAELAQRGVDRVERRAI